MKDRRRLIATMLAFATVTVIILQIPLASNATPAAARVLYLWAGDKGVGVNSPISPTKEYNQPDDPDFLAVVDAAKGSPTYGKVLHVKEVLTAAVGNEPHHMQPFIDPHCTGANRYLLAGGLFADTWFSWRVGLPGSGAATHPVDSMPSLLGMQLPALNAAQTRGAVPDAGFQMPNCEFLATEMGGDPTTGSYVGGPHGTIVRLAKDGKSVRGTQLASRIPGDMLCLEQWNVSGPIGKPGGPFTRKTSSSDCLPSNPHGIWARPDLTGPGASGGQLVIGDYATPGRLIQAAPPTADVAKLTVRHFNLTCAGLKTPGGATPTVPLGFGDDPCVANPRVVLLPDGPRDEANEGHEENVGIMEVGLTNPGAPFNPVSTTFDVAGHLESKGGFATSMCGGALYYTGDITATAPVWKEVYDYSATNAALGFPFGGVATSGCSGGGGVSVTPDNRHVVHTIIGRDPGQSGLFATSATDPDGFPGMVVSLDIQGLIGSGTTPSCNIDSVAEIFGGGAEADCPDLAGALVVNDVTSGGPHFFSFDYPAWVHGGTNRLAFFNYFVGETGAAGDLRVCMVNMSAGGALSLDTGPGGFPALGVDGQPAGSGCISFNRGNWPAPRGNAGPAQPHYGLFN
jgi:hypothetical protein